MSLLKIFSKDDKFHKSVPPVGYEIEWDEIYSCPEVEIVLKKDGNIIHHEQFFIPEFDPSMNDDDLYVDCKTKIMKRIKYIKEHAYEYDLKITEGHIKRKKVDEFADEVMNLPFNNG